jgi:hypothetical protein
MKYICNTLELITEITNLWEFPCNTLEISYVLPFYQTHHNKEMIKKIGGDIGCP